MYQRNFGIFAVCGNFMFQMILRGDTYLFRFFRTNDPVSVFQFILSLILPYLLHTLIFFIMINFYEHKNSLMKMQNYLESPGCN